MFIPQAPGIYCIIDRNTRKMYIGCSSKDMLARIENHIYKLKNGNHPSQELQRAFYEKHELDFVPLMEMPKAKKDAILETERKIIWALKTYDPEYGFNTNKRPPQQMIS